LFLTYKYTIGSSYGHELNSEVLSGAALATDDLYKSYYGLIASIWQLTWVLEITDEGTSILGFNDSLENSGKTV